MAGPSGGTVPGVAQVISGNSGLGTVPAGATRYFSAGVMEAAAALVWVPAGRRGRFRNLRVYTTAAPGAGQSWTLTLQNLSSDTALTCVISGSGSNTASDMLNSVVFEPGDRWSIKVVSSAGAPATSSIAFSVLFEGLD